MRFFIWGANEAGNRIRDLFEKDAEPTRKPCRQAEVTHYHNKYYGWSVEVHSVDELAAVCREIGAYPISLQQPIIFFGSEHNPPFIDFSRSY